MYGTVASGSIPEMARTTPERSAKLVGGVEHEFHDFPYIGNFIIPTDELIFVRGVGQPPTSIALLRLSW